MNFKNSKKGFTLVELMVVVAIMGILVAIAVPVYNASTDKASRTTCLYNVKQINTVLQRMITLGETNETAIASLSASEALELMHREDFLSEVPRCPDGGSYTKSGSTYSCSLHGTAQEDADQNDKKQTAADALLEAIKEAHGDTSWSSVKDFLVNQGYANAGKDINGTLREYLFQLNGGKWDSFTADGKDFYIQPMLNGYTNPDELFYYANLNNVSGTNWNILYVYNKDTESWYKYTGQSSYSAAGKKWSDILAEINANNGTWTEDTAITAKP